MPNEDDRFGDVAEQLKRTDDVRDDAGDDASDDAGDGASNEIVDGTSDDVVDGAGDDDPGTSDDGPGTGDEASDPTDADRIVEDATSEDDADPPFAFDETAMHGFYVRDETWERVTHARSSVTAACSMFDVPEFEGREFQDACLRVVAEHADEIALRILEERDVEADEERLREVVAMLSGGGD